MKQFQSVFKVDERRIDKKQETLNVESIQWHKSDSTHTFSSVAPGMLCSLEDGVLITVH